MKVAGVEFPGEGPNALTNRYGDSGPATSARSQVAPASESSGSSSQPQCVPPERHGAAGADAWRGERQTGEPATVG